MSDDEIMLLLCEAIEKLEVIERDDKNRDLLDTAQSLVKQARDELRYGLGDI